VAGRPVSPHLRPGPRAGFSLIEMVVVLAIVAILAMTAVPLQELVVRRVREQKARIGAARRRRLWPRLGRDLFHHRQGGGVHRRSRSGASLG